MRGTGHVGRLMSDMSTQRMRIMAAGESLTQGSRLDDPLIGKMFVGGCDNAQSRRSLVPS